MNIADLFEKQAKKHPTKVAVKAPKNSFFSKTCDQLTFEEFQKRSELYSSQFTKHGLRKGMKVLMFIKPSLDFSVITFSLFKIGAVPIFIDPGMGRKNFFNTIKSISPEAMVAIPKVYLLRFFFKSIFKSIKSSFTVGKYQFSNTISILNWKNQKITEDKEKIKINDQDLAAILFTSGGTGPPKGVEYTHHIFAKQTQMLRDLFNLTHEDIDLPGFPLFSLFTMSMGMTSVIPEMDPSKPSKVNPKKIIKNIIEHQTTFIAGSPAIWDKVGAYCLKHGIKLKDVKYLVMFGAPVSPKIHETWEKILPNGTTYTPYGATECLPISCISGLELKGDKTLKNKKGLGTCIGRPLPEVRVRIIEQEEKIISTIDQVNFRPPFEIGEIIVRSEVVTKSYHSLDEQTKKAKINDKEGLWHRMGDLGYFDDQGFLWFCGRSAHKVLIAGKIHSPIQYEAIINNIPEVRRSALIPYGKKAAIIIEPEKQKHLYSFFNKSLKETILSVAKENNKTKNIIKVFLKKSFPVDVRHNIKIDRIKLCKEFCKEYGKS